MDSHSTILHRFYHGSIRPSETICPSQPQYEEFFQQYEAQREQLEAQLNGSQRGALERLADLRAKIFAFELEATFEEGYRLGAQMTAEALKNQW